MTSNNQSAGGKIKTLPVDIEFAALEQLPKSLREVLNGPTQIPYSAAEALMLHEKRGWSWERIEMTIKSLSKQEHIRDLEEGKKVKLK